MCILYDLQACLTHDMLCYIRSVRQAHRYVSLKPTMVHKAGSRQAHRPGNQRRSPWRGALLTVLLSPSEGNARRPCPGRARAH